MSLDEVRREQLRVKVGRDSWTKRVVTNFSVVAVSLSLAGASAAEEGQRGARAVRYSLRYQAPEGCPSEEDVRRGIQTRTVRAEPAGDANADVRLAITLVREGEHTTGELVVTTSDGARSERRAGDASCEAAASSLAVMSALMLDAHVRAPALPVVAPEAPPAEAPPPRPSAAEKRPPSPVTRSSARMAVSLRARAGALWESAAAPTTALGALAGAELAWPQRGVVSRAVSVSALAMFSPRASTPAGSARFRLFAARVGVCPVALGLPLDARVRLCAEVDAGALRGEPGVSVLNARARTMPWLALGLAARAELPLAAGLSLELSGGGRKLARHDRFFFRPGVPVHDVPPWSAGATVGLCYGF